MHNSQDLIEIFNNAFYESENTILVRGDDEPIYLPADQNNTSNRLIFAHGFFSSALHEISHWCIAGKQRRNQIDFGYWYQPDGRTVQQQRVFESVEVRPQALEWIFHFATGKPFRVSADNLSGEQTDNSDFKSSVWNEVLTMLSQGLPPRGEVFRRHLHDFYKTNAKLNIASFRIEDL